MSEEDTEEEVDEEVDEELEVGLTMTIEPQSEYIDLPHGKDLNEDAAREISLERPICLIVIAGPVGCGKTTLLLSVYELFLQGGVPGWLFSGCSTFHGFELRCHPSRIASKREFALTERTLTSHEDGVHYLHLQLSRDEAPYVPIDFLFTDLTGEIYEDACNSTDDCKELTFAGRADHFILALDGKKIASAMSRHAAVQEGETLLRSMLDSGVLGLHSWVTVIFTKSDHFNVQNPAENGKEFRERVVTDIRNEFQNRVGHLSFAEIAARPKAGRNLAFGHGIPALLDHWVSSGPRLRAMQLSRFPGDCHRESEQFQNRYFSRS